MRIRDERLRSGRLLGWFDPEDRQRSSALMLLVRGIDDIEPLTRIERACGRALEAGEQGGFDWHHGDLGELASVDPMLAPSRVSRIEVAELAMLSTEEVEELLGPALTRLSSGEIQLFPAAGGAVGSPAEGIQFFGRDREVRDAVTRLKTGQSLEILAPRRSGKSSLMRRLHESLPEDWQGVFVNMEKEYTPEDLAARFWGLATGEPYRAGQRRAEEGWEKLTATAVGRLTAGSEVLVLLLDELVSFLQDQAPGEEGGSSAALTVLGALGRICDNPRVRLVTASSLPLAEYLHESLGLPRDRLPSFFRSLEALRLQPLDFPAPELELRRVLLGTGLVPEADDLEWLNENVGLALPYPTLLCVSSTSWHRVCAPMALPARKTWSGFWQSFSTPLTHSASSRAT